MNSRDMEDQELKAEIDEIMDSVNEVVQRLEKSGLLKKESKGKPNSCEVASRNAGNGEN